MSAISIISSVFFFCSRNLTWFPWLSCRSPGGSDVRRTHIAPLGSLPATRRATPPLSRVTRLRRVQRWLAPSPILPLPHSPFVFKYSPTLCTHPTQALAGLPNLIHTYHVGLPPFNPLDLELDLRKLTTKKHNCIIEVYYLDFSMAMKTLFLFNFPF